MPARQIAFCMSESDLQNVRIVKKFLFFVPDVATIIHYTGKNFSLDVDVEIPPIEGAFRLLYSASTGVVLLLFWCFSCSSRITQSLLARLLCTPPTVYAIKGCTHVNFGGSKGFLCVDWH